MNSLVPYITFPGNCEEAINFYAKCLNGSMTDISRFASGPMDIPNDHRNKIMHVDLRFPEGRLMASDSVPDQPVTAGNNVSLSLHFDDIDRMESVFKKLSEGGQVRMELQNTFWGARFGMFIDKYGIIWMTNCPLKA